MPNAESYITKTNHNKTYKQLGYDRRATSRNALAAATKSISNHLKSNSMNQTPQEDVPNTAAGEGTASSIFSRDTSTFGKILLLSLISFLSARHSLKISLSASASQGEDTYRQHNQGGDDNQFSLAQSQSFGFFNDISNDQWKLLQDIVAQHWDHKFPETPLMHHPAWKGRGHSTWDKRYPSWYQTNFEPNFSCQFERRVGATGSVSRGNGDGPKWICDPHRIKRLAAERKAKDPAHPGCVIYSIGSAGDFSFEKGMEEILGPGTCEYHIFDMGDFEEKMQKANITRAHYHRWGLDKQGEENLEPGSQFYGFRDTVKLIGHEHLDVIDVFKIDCEKCEWRIYRDWISSDLPSLQQIQVEIHSGDLGKMHKDEIHDHDISPEIPFFHFLEENGYVRFHKEPNIQYNDGSCEEYAFLKLDKEFFAPRKKVLAARNITRVDISS